MSALFTPLELMRLGAAVVDMEAASVLMRHTSAVGTVTYVDPGDDRVLAFYMDVVESHGSEGEDARERVRDLLEQHDVFREVQAGVGSRRGAAA